MVNSGGAPRGNSSGEDYRIPAPALGTPRRRRFATCLPALGLAWGLALGLGSALAQTAEAPAPAPAADAQASADQLAKLRERIATLQRSLEQDRGQQDELRNQIEDVERKQHDLRRQLRALNTRLAAQAETVRKTQAERAQAEGLAARHRKTLASQVRAAYIIGQRGQAKLILNQDHTARLSRVLTYYDYLNRARIGHIQQILAQVQALAQIESRLKEETAALEATRTEQQNALGALRAAKARRKDMLQQLTGRIAGKEDELKGMRASEQQLANLIQELRSALADVPADIGGKPFAQLKGKLPWPLRGKLLARFGEFKPNSDLKWNGLWIAALEGNPVRAVARGRVAYVGWMHRYGLIAILEHEGGYYSLYGHAQSVAVNVGDWVDGGAVIAAAGNSGGHDKSGVYFELRKGSDPVNPRLWLKKG